MNFHLFFALLLLAVPLTTMSLRLEGSWTAQADLEEAAIPPDTVDSIDLDAYMGRWYQMYASLRPNQTVEKDTFCPYGDAFILTGDDRAFGLINSATRSSPTGVRITGAGTAYKTSSPGKFVLKSNDDPLLKVDYWIVALGERASPSDLYPWAVISTPYRLDCVIIARDVEQFRVEYKEEVLKKVKKMGFDERYNRPRESYHGPDCSYPPLL